MMQTGRERDAARERNRERKRRGNRKYGQAKLKHAKKGITSVVLAGMVLVLYVVLILVSFLHKGQTPALTGSFGLFGILIAWAALVTGIRGFRERDKNYLTCKIGIGVSAFILLCFIATFIRGLV